MNMAWNRIACAFLHGVLFSTVLAQVPTPTNVTLQCHNIHNVLRWNYDQHTPGLKFKVLVKSGNSDAVELVVNSPTHHADLSSFSDPNDSFLVSVSAVMGDNVSAPSAGITYSYFQDATEDHNCNLDFPAVNVTLLEDNVIHLRFMHPGLLYSTNPKPKKRKIELPPFDFDVKVINQSKHSRRFYCDEEVCEGKIVPVDSSQEKYCLHMEGTMNKISVQPTREYCSSSDEQTSGINNTSYFYLLIVLGLISLAIIIVMVCMKKIRPSIPAPDILKFNGSKNEQLVSPKDQDETCVVHVEPASSTHLLSTLDVNDSTLVDAPSIESDLRLPLRVSTNDSSMGDQAEEMQEDVEECGYKTGNALDEDYSQNQDSGDTGGYEKRSRLE